MLPFRSVPFTSREDLHKDRIYSSDEKMPRQTRQSLPAMSSTPYARPDARHKPSSAWTAEDDNIIMEARASGMSWKDMAPRYFGVRKSDNACRKRHERLIKAQRSQEWDGRKLDQLAAEYVAIREQIWTPLATRMGESWDLVEAKVSLRQRPVLEI